MITLINGIMTGVLLVVFLGIWGWAWSARNKSHFDSMAQLPLEGDSESGEGNYHE